MGVLRSMKLSVEVLWIAISLGYVFYFYFIGGKDISIWAQYNFANGELYLSYIHAIIAFFAVLFVFSLFSHRFSEFLKKIVFSFTSANKKQATMITQFILQLILLIKYIGAILVAMYCIKENSVTREWLGNARMILATIFFVYIISGTIKIVLEKKFQGLTAKKSSHASILRFINKILFIVFWILGLAFILSRFGYNVNALFAGAGIGGLAVALAAQKSITNIFGAITILFNKPFQIGDYININGQEGTVKDIGLTYVTLTDKLGHQVMMPNENIITSSIANYSVRESRRVDFTLGLVYETSLEKMKEGVSIVENILKKYREKNEITEDMRVSFDMFNAFSLDIKVTYFSLSGNIGEFNHQKQSINLEIKEAFEKSGLEMAFPTSEMIIKNESTEKSPVKSPTKK